jgi:hypothetical protein
MCGKFEKEKALRLVSRMVPLVLFVGWVFSLPHGHCVATAAAIGLAVCASLAAKHWQPKLAFKVSQKYLPAFEIAWPSAYLLAVAALIAAARAGLPSELAGGEAQPIKWAIMGFAAMCCVLALIVARRQPIKS